MNAYLLIMMIALVAVMLISNIRKARGIRKDERYIDCYTSVLKNEVLAAGALNEYIESETDPELKNKALIVKVFTDILENRDPKETIEKIELNDVFFVNGAYEPEKVSRNSDAFTWLMLDMAKARSLSMIDVMDALYEKIHVYDDKLNRHVEYNVFKAAYEVMLEKDVEGIDFLKKLIGGEYADYVYDKALIGVFKKFVTALLVYSGEPVDTDDESILYDFATTQVGNKFLAGLGILDKYLTKEEENKEETETVEATAGETEEETEEITEEDGAAEKTFMEAVEEEAEELAEDTRGNNEAVIEAVDELKEKVKEIEKNLEEK